jgi:hypothetical protein
MADVNGDGLPIFTYAAQAIAADIRKNELYINMATQIQRGSCKI